MTSRSIRWLTAVASAVCCAVLLQALATAPAAAVTLTRGELRNGLLKVQGIGAPGIRIIATSTTSAASGRADQTGRFKIEARDFTAPDCRIVVSDGNRTPSATLTLAGCAPSVVPVPPAPAPPTGSCLITPQDPATLSAGVDSVVFFATTGCDTTTGSGATPTPVQWSVVAGSIPIGMIGPSSQGTISGNIIGMPTTGGTYVFTLQVVDQVGATDQETFTVVVG